jgi:hypothetical protein
MVLKYTSILSRGLLVAEEEKNQGLILAFKIISIVVILAITVMFGFFPFFW